MAEPADMPRDAAPAAADPEAASESAAADVAAAADTAAAVSTLRSAATIRERCAHITRAVDEGRSPHFTLDRAQLDATAARVEAVTRAAYPDLRIPYHSRWRHFEAGGVDRKRELDARLAGRDRAAQARSRIDLTVVSVLLDAGAGAGWRFDESAVTPAPGSRPVAGASHARSEGLGVASWHAFLAGRFSSDRADPLRVDGAALQNIDAAALADIFQAGPDNPLVGLDGRAALLRRLGDALAAQPATFGADARPGALFDALTQHGRVGTLPATALLEALLGTLSAIWPSGQSLGGVPLGDCWRHPEAGGSGPSAGWVPFHKLSQWLAYSLLEPFAWAGVSLTDVDGLTGLPEYRNGGLLLDGGVIVPRDPGLASRRHAVDDDVIVEWRALTVSLLDELAPRLRARLGVSAAQLPLARVLEGGSWAAGRQIAAERRAGGAPPLAITSDGTVF